MIALNHVDKKTRASRSHQAGVMIPLGLPNAYYVGTYILYTSRIDVKGS